MNKEYKKYGDERETTQNKKKQKTKRKQIKYNENSPPKTKRKGNEKKNEERWREYLKITSPST